jgi:antitoxin component of RelBE/YafQ-DinJ toxin-antitoxin module
MKLKNVFSIMAMLMIVFFSGCKKDDPPVIPTVLSTDPANVATGVTLNKLIVVTFSEPMDQTTVNSVSIKLNQELISVSGTVTGTGNSATFTPAVAMQPDKVYTATITTAAKNMTGNGMIANHVFTFTTGAAPDVTPPAVASTDPLNSAITVAVNKAIKITFSEAMDPLTITPSSLILMQGTTAVSGAVTSSGTTATFTPTANLEYSKVYTCSVTTSAKDLSANALAVIYNFSFTTAAAPDIIAPTVLSTDPVSGASAVDMNKVVSVTLSEAMDPLTITSSTFYLKQGTTTVSGTVSYSGTTAKFTASSILAAGTVYNATMTTGAKDKAGNPLAANKEWSFTTGSSSAVLATVNLGTAGDYVILAKSAINNSAPSAITGDIGLSPAATSYITGFSLTNATGYATSAQITGKIFAADMAAPTGINLTTAVENMITAYTDAAGRPIPDFLELYTGNIGGKTLTPGLYKWTSTVTMPTSLTISGNANDIWIFQISGDLTMSDAVNITLNGGAQAKNIFWQVAGEATIGSGSHFEGIILSQTGITLRSGASFTGRALAQTAVILDSNTVVNP